MELRLTDYNRAGEIIPATENASWAALAEVVAHMPLYVKASDQAGKIGTNIFDPVATNAHFSRELAAQRGWQSKIPVPAEFQFLGTDIDFGTGGLLLEVQFSNYPFLLNNLLRSELFYKARDRRLLTARRLEAVIILTKGGMFPASNSTLYYEQAQRQLNALAAEGVFTVPIRLVGLFSPTGVEVTATRTTYQARYSRVAGAVEQVRITFPHRIAVADPAPPDLHAGE